MRKHSPCHAEEAEDAMLKRPKREFFDFFRPHHECCGLCIFRKFFCVIFLKFQILMSKHDLRLMKTDINFSTENVEKKDDRSQHVFKMDLKISVRIYKTKKI